MRQLSNEELKSIFNSNDKKTFKKVGNFIFRTAEEGETVLTIVAGKLETFKTAGKDEIVIRNMEINSSAETYIIPRETFKKRYSIDMDKAGLKIDNRTWLWCVPSGQVNAFEYTGEVMKFIAPWGEEMLCEAGDYIANPVGGSPADIYRIEKETFLKTYKLV